MEQDDDARQRHRRCRRGGTASSTGTDEPATIELTQLDVKKFALRSSLTLRRAVRRRGAPREVGPDSLPTTDLTSVPGPLRWFVSPYGLHTPAALLHDRLVGDEAPEGFARTDADRLFRHMLDCLGVPFLRRWLMWAAVAYGTRWSAKGLRRVGDRAVDGASPLVGMVVLGARPWRRVSLPLLAVAAALPFPAALLWGRQYGGGLIAAGQRAVAGPAGDHRRHSATASTGCSRRRCSILPTAASTAGTRPARRTSDPQCSRVDRGRAGRRPCLRRNPRHRSNAQTPSGRPAHGTPRRTGWRGTSMST